ncbi:hypothetical protein GWI33_012201 [Rhynchophorus ferrugineus]|uniref:Uncharacterized protein n=1 Tax=Rhynchophorus ferrugineus TaxID=354439 RepID=A0A834MEC4_RHYFE|nr:hypothetical protein GWI33_012201 [Rhynchophorus ferrugineus]
MFLWNILSISIFYSTVDNLVGFPATHENLTEYFNSRLLNERSYSRSILRIDPFSSLNCSGEIPFEDDDDGDVESKQSVSRHRSPHPPNINDDILIGA